VLLTFIAMAVVSACDPAPLNDDPIARVLRAEATCPGDVFTFRDAIVRKGGHLETALVANRGFHNPSQGSFSMFEMVLGTVAGQGLMLGDVFLGHFTTPEGMLLTPEQGPVLNALMVEAFAWDNSKGYYNFYELRGDGVTGLWSYRGDSFDILVDNRLLHRQPTPSAPRFGDRLRCSGCHMNGGPIMKELTEPYNDWWNPQRPLDFGQRTPDARIAAVLKTLVPAARLAEAVRVGLAKLELSTRFTDARKALTFQEQLRPLFCPMEVNFASDTSNIGPVTIPADFFVDPRLQPRGQSGVRVERTAYNDMLVKAGSRFPETALPDADHAWLTPVKSASDIGAVQTLIDTGVLDTEFVADVLAVDMTEPALSNIRCGLLRLIPDAPKPDWRAAFVTTLLASTVPGAAELHKNLTDPERTAASHQARAHALIARCASDPVKFLPGMYGALAWKRDAVAANEISKNPRGQILEPGFRVIFPQTPFTFPRAHLSETCEPEAR
jgi:hypothetical protein